ncbi:hypothetical protein [Curtobacterium sp. MCBD17_040]|uniref:hypothetical protein n=1 Tax=Curtobacterium sp. MCBD17_040 TaxID=2175674 RepID=UPI000DA7874B|nr:hypothetical protein [Curtobacterium sp. MCBD17_040]WIB65755.1 hypothetical protein DEI94_16690 [Curtobacterium sp. MCBD17_040]
MLDMDIEGMPEDERLTILAQLEANRPGSAAKAGGTLAGPATPDRPDIPVWDYQRHVDEHPDVDIADLIAVRFPVVLYGGEDFTITSVADHLNLPVRPSQPWTLATELDMWNHLHTAGIVRWNSERRAVEHIRPQDDYRAALHEWGIARRADADAR